MKTSTKKKVTATKAVVKKAAKCCCKKAASAAPAAKAVTFTVHAEKGKTVYLAGDFNQWKPTDKKMTFKNGVYSASVKLAPGEYQYKFIIDGAWCADPENVNAIPNDQGTFNSIITVK